MEEDPNSFKKYRRTKILTEEELHHLKERVQSFLNEITFELYIVAFSKLHCARKSSIICFYL